MLGEENEKNSWPCGWCHKYSANKYTLKRHTVRCAARLKEEGDVVFRDERFKCKVCHNYFASKGWFEQHTVRCAAGGVFFFQCVHCLKKFASQGKLRKHWGRCVAAPVLPADEKAARKAALTADENPPQLLICLEEGCGKGFSSVYYLRKHSRDEHPVAHAAKADEKAARKAAHAAEADEKAARKEARAGKEESTAAKPALVMCLEEGCGKGFSSVYYLRQHSRDEHPVAHAAVADEKAARKAARAGKKSTNTLVAGAEAFSSLLKNCEWPAKRFGLRLGDISDDSESGYVSEKSESFIARILELNVSKTSIFPKGVTAQAAFDMAQTIMQATQLTSVTTFSSIPSALKVSLALVCLLALMLLYGVLWLKHVGIS